MDDYCVRIRGELTDDDGWQQDLAQVGDYGAWWEVPLPPCPDCGGDLVWGEAGYVPGTRCCAGRPVCYVDGAPQYHQHGGCGSLFHVCCRDGRVRIRRERSVSDELARQADLGRRDRIAT